MTTMYDKMLMLPIFQGISVDELTGILEQVHFEFKKINPKEIIIKQGEEVKEIQLLISGSVVMQTRTPNRKMLIQQHLRAPMTLPIYHTFGIDTCSNYTISALTEVGIMKLSKQEFLAIVQKYPVLLLNVLNILSLRAQRMDSTLELFSCFDEAQKLAWWLKSVSIRFAFDIEIKASVEEMCKALALEVNIFWKAILRLEEIGAISYRNETLKLLDRYALRRILGEKNI